MAFETTVDSGTVNFKTLPDGEIEVYVATPLGTILSNKIGFLAYLLGFVLVLMFFAGLIGFIGGASGFGTLAVGGAIVGTIALMKTAQIKWFSIVPRQGLKFKGGQVSFSDIDSVITLTRKKAAYLQLNVRGKEVPLVEGTEAEVDYIKQVLRENSNLKFS